MVRTVKALVHGPEAGRDGRLTLLAKRRLGAQPRAEEALAAIHRVLIRRSRPLTDLVVDR
jgi:hypothetical protein